MATNYTTKTAALRATKADINKLDAKKMLLNGKNILDYISDSEFDSYDTRDPQLKNDELDIWNTEISLSDNGHIEVKPFEHANNSISSTQSTTIKSAVKVIDNEVLGADDTHLMYWQTDGLTYGKEMFNYSENLTWFFSDLSSLTDGSHMFYTANLSEFVSDLSSLTNGNRMFAGSNLKSFYSDLSSLTNGGYMFHYCDNLISFNSGSYGSLMNSPVNLSSLTNGDNMFHGCTALTRFPSDLPSLTNGSAMFYHTALTSFSSDLSSLTNGSSMFHSCSALTSFSSDLSKLTDGMYMFDSCTALTSFSSDLSNLTNGFGMFTKCKLDAQSVANIIHFIPQRDAKPTSTEGEGNIYIGVGITNTDAAKQAFAEECDCENWADLNKEFDDKNWAVQWQFNGEATTYGLRDPRPSTAVYARLEEVFMPTEEEIAEAKENGEHIQTPHYQYTSQDGSKFYNIHWYHDSNTDNEGYDYFESLEMATIAYGVTPKA